MKKRRSIFVITFIVIFLIYSYVGIRGDYLQNLGIGEQYLEIFKQNQEQKIAVFAISFLIMYIIRTCCPVWRTSPTTRYLRRPIS